MLKTKINSPDKTQLQPKKKFGQNFLTNRQMQVKVVQKMQSLTQKYPHLPLVEIGPGQGDLTQHFVQFDRPIQAIEIDPEAVHTLQNKFANNQNLAIIQADALKLLGVQNGKLKTKNDELETTSNSPLLRGTSPSDNRGLMAQTDIENVALAGEIPPSPQQATLSAFGPPGNPETNAQIPPNPLERGSSTLNLTETSKLPSNSSSLEGGGPEGRRMSEVQGNTENLALADPSLPPNFILLANLPFNVGSRILVDLPIYYPHIPFAVILQKEVAEKVRQDKDFTFFGAWLNLFWNLKVEFDIAPGNFYPSPKVYSSLLIGEPKYSENESVKLANNLNHLTPFETQNSKLKMENDELETKSNSPLLRGMSPSGDRGLAAQTNTENVAFAGKIPPNSLERGKHTPTPNKPPSRPLGPQREPGRDRFEEVTLAGDKHPPTPFKGGLSTLNSPENFELPENPSSLEGGGPGQAGRMSGLQTNAESHHFNHLTTPQSRLYARKLLQTLFRKPRKTIANNLKDTEFEYLLDKIKTNERLEWQNYERVLCQLRGQDLPSQD